jgi:hypothetical protein
MRLGKADKAMRLVMAGQSKERQGTARRSWSGSERADKARRLYKAGQGKAMRLGMAG